LEFGIKAGGLFDGREGLKMQEGFAIANGLEYGIKAGGLVGN